MYDILSTTTKKRDPENVGVAVGIFSLRALYNSRYAWGGIFTPRPSPPPTPPVAGKRRKKRCREKG